MNRFNTIHLLLVSVAFEDRVALLRCFERSSCGGGSWMGLCGPAQTFTTILWRGKLDGVVRPCPNIYDNIVKGGMNGAVQPCPNIYNNIATLYLF